MALDIFLPKKKQKTGQQALPFLGPKIWTKIRRSTKNVKTTASLTHIMESEI